MPIPKKDTNRIAKVNSLIQHELGPILLECTKDLKGLVTITKVETSRDMKWAKVWISIFPTNKSSPALEPSSVSPDGSTSSPKGRRGGTQTVDDKILNHLKTNIYDIQGELNKHFFTKIIPRLQFFLDTSPRYVQRIDELIKKIHEEGQ